MRKKETKIGLIILTAVTLLVVGVNFLKGKNIFSHQREFVAFYDHIDGLGVSNPVTVNGFRIGQVSAVELDALGNIKVAFQIQEENIRIPKNSEAKISTSDLFGSKSIILVLGDSPLDAVSGDTLLSTIGLGLKEALSQRLDPLQKKTEDVILQFNRVLEDLDKIIGVSAQKDIGETFQNIAASIENLKTTTMRIDTMVMKEGEKISSVITDVKGMSGEFAVRQQKLGATLDNFIAVGDELAEAQLGETILRAKDALEQTSQLLLKINSGKGTLGALANSDSLHDALVSSAKDLEYLLEDIRVNPDRYLHFSVFGAKDKSVSLTRSEADKLKEVLKK